MKQYTLKQIQEMIMDQAEEKGFGTKPEDISVPEKMILIHSEVSEAYEAYRHNKIEGNDGFKEELADIVQRVLHLCGIFEIDMEKEILRKLNRNKDRKWDFSKMNEKNSKK